MQKQTLRHWLQLQCDRLEAILAARQTPVRVVGGEVGRGRIALYVQPSPHVRLCDIDAAYMDGDLWFLGDNLRVLRVSGWAVLVFGIPIRRNILGEVKNDIQR